MPRGDRAVRRERAKTLGRIAFRLARAGEIFGNMEIEGEEKRLTEYSRGRLFVDLLAPWRAEASATEFSRLRVMWDNAKVMELRWDRADHFHIALFKDGESDWQDALQRLA